MRRPEPFILAVGTKGPGISSSPPAWGGSRTPQQGGPTGAGTPAEHQGSRGVPAPARPAAADRRQPAAAAPARRLLTEGLQAAPTFFAVDGPPKARAGVHEVMVPAL